MVKKVGQLLDEVTGDPVAPATPVDIRLISDDSLISTVSTDADGYYSYTANGNPGPTYDEATVGGATRKNSTKTINGAGPIDLSALRFNLQTFTPGVIYSYPGKMTGEGLSVIANGTTMIVAVDVGASTAYGVTHVQTTTKNITVDTAPVSGTRTDTIYVRHYYAAATEGKTEILYVADSSSYEADANQTVGWRDVHLATITVDAGVSAIAINKVTDRRTYASPQIASGYIAAHMLASGLGFPQVTNINEFDPLTFAGLIISDTIDNLIVSDTIALPTGSWSGLLHFTADFQIGHSAAWPNLNAQADVTVVEQGLTIDGGTFAVGSSMPILVVIPLVDYSGSLFLSLKARFDAAEEFGNRVSNARIYGTLIRTA